MVCLEKFSASVEELEIGCMRVNLFVLDNIFIGFCEVEIELFVC